MSHCSKLIQNITEFPENIEAETEGEKPCT